MFCMLINIKPLQYIQKSYNKNLPCVFFEKQIRIYKKYIYKFSKFLNLKNRVCY